MAAAEDLEDLVVSLRAHTLRLGGLSTKVDDLSTRVDALAADLADHRQETRAGFRSVDEQLAEIKDLILRR